MEIAVACGRVTGPIVLLLLTALGVLVAAYAAGLITTLGYESRRVTYGGGVSSGGAGGGFGLKKMLFFKGQTFYADYDATVRKGSLRIGVMEAFGQIGKKPHYVKSIKASGKGMVTYRIPKTSMYSIYFDGSVIGKGNAGGYDVTYSVRWGVR